MRWTLLSLLLWTACGDDDASALDEPVPDEAVSLGGLTVGARWTYLRSGEEPRWKEVTACEDVEVVGPDGTHTVRAYVRENRSAAGLTSVHYLVVGEDGIRRARRDDIDLGWLSGITTYEPYNPRLFDGPYVEGEERRFTVGISEVDPVSGQVRGTSQVEAVDTVRGVRAVEVVGASFATVLIERQWLTGEPHVVRSYYAPRIGEVLEEEAWPERAYPAVEELVSYAPGFGLCDRPLEGAPCDDPLRTCDDAWGAAFRGCTDPRVDSHNCGACGVECDSGVCAGGICQAPACDLECGGSTICCEHPWDAEAAGCTSPARDVHNCGGCGLACEAWQTCRLGACECAPGTADCTGDGICADLMNDPEHCGACGETCSGDTPMCELGICVSTCDALDLDECDGQCVDLRWNDEHCGTCGELCGPGTGTVSCADGQCTPCAAFEQDDCDGTCEDLDWSDGNCGACGQACLADEVCVRGECIAGDGSCAMSCGDDELCCGGECYNPRGSDTHCGGCGVDQCAGGCSEACRDGQCEAVVCGDGGDD